MEIREGTKLIENKTKKAIVELVFDDYIIYIFQGRLSRFDIVIKYTKDDSRVRTPKHIHWTVDVLMKMQGNEQLTKQFLKAIQKWWQECTPLDSNDYETIKGLLEKNENDIEIEKYAPLNAYGEYDVEFLYSLMELLAVQEKTNRPDAYLFGSIINELLKDKLDIFKIVSTAGFGGRKR